jgi:hypothetical protein
VSAPLAAWPAPYVPPVCTGTVFTDVACTGPFDSWIEQLGRDHVAGSCGGGHYCPDNPVTRGQLAALLEKAMRGTDTWHPSQGIYTRTLIVSPVPGDALASGASLTTAMASITDASPTNRYLVKIEPGNFDLGPAELQAKPFVDIEGSGEGATRIVGHGSNLDEHATLLGADSCEVRFLTIENLGGLNLGQGIRNDDVSPSFLHVAVRVSGFNQAVGVRNLNSAAHFRSVTVLAAPELGYFAAGIYSESPIVLLNPPAIDLLDSVIVAQGTGYSYGVYSNNTSPHIRGGRITAYGGSATAIFSTTLSSPLLEDVEVIATGMSAGRGIDTSGSGHPRLHNVRVVATGGPNSYVSGVYTLGGDVEIEDSSIVASTTGGSRAIGVHNDIVSAKITRSTMRALGANDMYGNYGIFNDSSPGGVIAVHNSIVEGKNGSVFNLGSGYELRVGASQLVGPVLNQNGATSICVHAYDGNFQPLDPNCSP